MKKGSFFKKIFLIIVVVFTLSSSVLIYSVIKIQELSLLQVMYSKAKTTAKSISLVSSDAMITEDYSFLIEFIEKVLGDNDEIVYTVITRKNGNSLYSRSSHWSMLDKLPKQISEKLNKKINGNITYNIFNNEEVYNFTYPVVFSGIDWGWINIGYSLKQYNKNMKIIYINSIILLFLIIIVSISIAYFLTRKILKPILELNRAVQDIAHGNFNTTVEVYSNDEIAELAKSFNYMIQELKNSDNKLRNMNSELEQRVQQRTQQLEELNIGLDQKVKEEVMQRSKQEQLLIQQSRFAAMGEMIGNIAHQWRQPLNALSLLLQNIENAYDMNILDEKYIVRTVNKGTLLTNSMSKTIDDFRDFFKPNKKVEVFNIAEAIHGTLEIIGASFSNHMIDIEENIDMSLCAKGFSNEFSQVILNILNNSKDELIQRGIKNKKIKFIVKKVGEKLIIEIEDNAGGIPTDIINKVFDPYFSTKEEGKGTGIGLYMSKTIIEHNMHGQLSVRNEEEGAIFKIVLESAKCITMNGIKNEK